MNIVNRIRLFVGLVATAMLSALVALTVASAPAPVAAPALTPAASTTDANPWNFVETNDEEEGLRIDCAEGDNGNCFVLYDYGPLPSGDPQPIAGVLRAGGLWVAGDFLSVYGADIFKYHYRVDPLNTVPPAGECLGLTGVEGRIYVIAGQGPTSGMYKCKIGGYGFYWALIAG